MDKELHNNILRQKKTLEESIIKISTMKIRPWNIIKFLLRLRNLATMTGLWHIDLKQNDLDFCSMARKMQEQFDIINERLDKLESK